MDQLDAEMRAKLVKGLTPRGAGGKESSEPEKPQLRVVRFFSPSAKERIIATCNQLFPVLSDSHCHLGTKKVFFVI